MDWSELEREEHGTWLELHRVLLRIRHDEIHPRIGAMTGRDAWYEMRGPHALFARWMHDMDGLVLEANLGNEPQSGFSERPRGRAIFATHDHFAGGVAPAWSVRWSID
ncbi:MAG: DUF3459 domain-containing protein [Vulcanimicrobiaceae bacterium]